MTQSVQIELWDEIRPILVSWADDFSAAPELPFKQWFRQLGEGPALQHVPMERLLHLYRYASVSVSLIDKAEASELRKLRTEAGHVLAWLRSEIGLGDKRQ